MSTLSEKVSGEIFCADPNLEWYCGVVTGTMPIIPKICFLWDIIISVLGSKEKMEEAKFDYTVMGVTQTAFCAYITEKQAEAISKQSSEVFIRKEVPPMYLFRTHPPISVTPIHLKQWPCLTNDELERCVDMLKLRLATSSGVAPMDVDE